MIFRILLFLFICSNAFANEQNVLVPIRKIKKGEIITERDVEIDIMKTKNRNYISNINDNTKAARNLEIGKPIRITDVFVDLDLVHKGNTITARLIKKNLLIEFQALALTNGREDDIIRVKNLDTNKILSGKVMNDGSVAIYMN